MKDINQNNFDLIRLFAALQVAIVHCSRYLEFDNKFLNLISYFPGVPIFFFISGFLIYGSFEKSRENPKALTNFYVKRILRLFPALWLCFLVSLISVWQSGFLEGVEIKSSQFIAWIVTQTTFFQFYNPEFLRGYGVGVLNGSLWTISVELQFYSLTPILFLFLKLNNKKSILTILTVLVVINIINNFFNDRVTLLGKLFFVSFLPWFYMFVMGALFYKYSFLLSIIKKIPLSIFCLAYIVNLLTVNYFVGWGNSINPILFLTLVCLVTKLAFSLPKLSNTILNRNDISYGIYIYHMPIVNYLLHLNMKGGFAFTVALSGVVISALLSWFLMEKKILAFKRNSLRGT